MRVIGGKDYYDGAVSFDTDTTRCFVRDNHMKSKPIKVPELNGFYRRLIIRSSLYSRKASETFRCISIIFCGKVYNLVIEISDEELHHVHAKEVIHFSKKTLLEAMNKRNVKMISDRKSLWQPSARDLSQNDLDEFFTPQDVSKDVMDYLIDNKVIVAIRKSITEWAHMYSNEPNGNWFINTDGLKEYGFGSLVDPWTANQEIDMFLGTILVREEDRQIQISDKSKIGKYGFDQWSFRNQSHRGKPRQRV